MCNMTNSIKYDIYFSSLGSNMFYFVIMYIRNINILECVYVYLTAWWNVEIGMPKSSHTRKKKLKFRDCLTRFTFLSTDRRVIHSEPQPSNTYFCCHSVKIVEIFEFFPTPSFSTLLPNICRSCTYVRISPMEQYLYHAHTHSMMYVLKLMSLVESSTIGMLHRQGMYNVFVYSRFVVL